jgi:hypothetical protein
LLATALAACDVPASGEPAPNAPVLVAVAPQADLSAVRVSDASPGPDFESRTYVP